MVGWSPSSQSVESWQRLRLRRGVPITGEVAIFEVDLAATIDNMLADLAL